VFRTFLASFALLCPLMAETITGAERDKLVAHLERTRAIFLKSIDGVGPAQWTFKASPDRWSIAECAEHIVATEGALMGLVQNLMKSPPPAAPPARRATDDGLMKFIVDRSQKAKAPEMLQPKSKYPSPAEVKADFEKARAASVAYVKSTKDDLRSRFGGNFPAGSLDGYQYLLMMAGHSERHSMQIEEVKTSAGYPK
jgi:hypothetical protein